MGEDTTDNQQVASSALLQVTQSYFQKLLDPAPADHTILELEQKVLSEGVELLATARKANDQPAIGYLSSLLKTHLDKGHNYSNAYQSALTALNPPPETLEVDGIPKKPKKAYHLYPELNDDEISAIVEEYKTSPKEWYSEKELVAILKHNKKLPTINSFRLEIKALKLINKIRENRQTFYQRESIDAFLKTIDGYAFVDGAIRDEISREIKTLNWKIYKIFEHPSLQSYVKNVESLFGKKSENRVSWLYKVDSYEKLIQLMKKLVETQGVENHGKAQSKPDEAPKAKRPRKPKPSNGNGVLLDWAGIEKHFDLKSGTIVGTDLQDQIEDILGSPEVPKDGSPGYPESLLEKKRNAIIKLLNA